MVTETSLLAIIIVLLFATFWFLLEEVWDLAHFSRKSSQKEVRNLSTLRAISLFEHHDEITAIDVRPIEYFQKNRLPNALNAPYLNDSLDTTNIAGLDHSKPILIYCDGGYRSRQAIPALVSAGFTKVFHLNRGMLGWRLFGGPTEAGEISRA